MLCCWALVCSQDGGYRRERQHGSCDQVEAVSFTAASIARIAEDIAERIAGAVFFRLIRLGALPP